MFHFLKYPTSSIVFRSTIIRELNLGVPYFEYCTLSAIAGSGALESATLQSFTLGNTALIRATLASAIPGDFVFVSITLGSTIL